MRTKMQRAFDKTTAPTSPIPALLGHIENSAVSKDAITTLEALYVQADQNTTIADTERSREYWRGRADAYRRTLKLLSHD